MVNRNICIRMSGLLRGAYLRRRMVLYGAFVIVSAPRCAIIHLALAKFGVKVLRSERPCSVHFVVDILLKSLSDIRRSYLSNSVFLATFVLANRGGTPTSFTFNDTPSHSQPLAVSPYKSY